MKQKIALFTITLKISLRAVLVVMKNWKYVALSIGVSFVFIQFLYWVLNASLFWYFLTTNGLTVVEKIEVFSRIIGSYLSSLPLWQSIVVVLLALVQGMVISVLVYTVRAQHTLDKRAFGGSAIASMIAMVSVGCVSCGTSIIAPIISIFISSATVSISEAINKISVIIGLLIALYALYAVGKTAANIQAKHKFTSKDAVIAPIDIE